MLVKPCRKKKHIEILVKFKLMIKIVLLCRSFLMLQLSCYYQSRVKYLSVNGNALNNSTAITHGFKKCENQATHNDFQKPWLFA